jgi:predicted ATPase
MIALTGGPGAGKTAILEMARKTFCSHTAVLPEAATIVFGGGFWRRTSVPGRRAAQRAIYHVQHELERIVDEERLAAVALCDRGTPDALAYWPGRADEFWREIGSSLEKEFARYAAVIHLTTPRSDGAYNHSNPIRIETVEEAAAIDDRLLKAWEGHPRRFVVSSTPHFLDKALETLQLVRAELPDCCRGH